MRIRQIVFAAEQLATSRDLLAGLFGLPTPFRDPGVAEFGIDNAVFTFGDQFIELISPTQADTATGRHLARQGDSAYMLLLQTDDLAHEQARFAALGVRSVWTSPPFDDIRAMHLHPKDLPGAIVSVDQPTPAASWRWGGPAWMGGAVAAQGQPLQAGEAGRQRVLGLTLAARDPQALALRWAEVLARPAPQPQGDGWRVTLTDGFADFTPAAAGATADRVAGFSLAVADPAAVLARAQAAGLVVAGQALTLLGTVISLSPVAAASAVLESPVTAGAEATAGLPTLPDRLAVDPRSKFHVAAVFQRDIGVRFNGKDRSDVEEYCLSEGWIRVAAGKAVDRRGQPLLVKLKGRVEVFYR